MALIDELALPPDDRSAAIRGLRSKTCDAVVRVGAAVPPDGCAALQAAVDAEWLTRPDSVDGAPDMQLNLSVDRLAELAGDGAVAALTLIAKRMRSATRSHPAPAGTRHEGDDKSSLAASALNDGLPFDDMSCPDIFVRRCVEGSLT